MSLIKNEPIYPFQDGDYTKPRHIIVEGTNEEIGFDLARNEYDSKLGLYSDAAYGRARREYLKRNWPAMLDRSRGVLRAYGLSPDDSLSEHDHGVEFETWRYKSYEPLHLSLLQQLLNHLPSTLFRAKGFVYAADKPHLRLLLQLVGRRAVLSVNRPREEETPQTRLVLIARQGTVKFAELEKALQSCQDQEPISHTGQGD